MPRCPSRGNTPLICPRHVGRQEPEPAGKHANLVEKNESATHLPMDLGCRLKATNAGLDVASAAVAAAFCRALCADRRLVRLIPETDPCGVLGILCPVLRPRENSADRPANLDCATVGANRSPPIPSHRNSSGTRSSPDDLAIVRHSWGLCMILTDNETKVDLLNNEAIAATIVKLLRDRPDQPVTVGVHGDWGAGKSSIRSSPRGRTRLLFFRQRRDDPFWQRQSTRR